LLRGCATQMGEGGGSLSKMLELDNGVLHQQAAMAQARRQVYDGASI
jgi:hypothetical protein